MINQKKCTKVLWKVITINKKKRGTKAESESVRQRKNGTKTEAGSA